VRENTFYLRRLNQEPVVPMLGFNDLNLSRCGEGIGQQLRLMREKQPVGVYSGNGPLTVAERQRMGEAPAPARNIVGDKRLIHGKVAVRVETFYELIPVVV
jgi:hypothetical protein